MDPTWVTGQQDEQKIRDPPRAQEPTDISMSTDSGMAQPSDSRESKDSTEGTTVPKSQSRAIDQTSPNVEEDALMTPKIRDWSSTHTPSSLLPSTAVKDTLQLQEARVPAAPSAAEPGEYFPPAPSLTSNVADFAKDPSRSSEATSLVSPRDPDTSSTSSPATPNEHAGILKDAAAESTTGPNHNPGNPRPTSVPNFQSVSLSRRRDLPDYPQYPNQSFAALQKHPAHPHPLRTRTSNPLHESSYISSNASSTNNVPNVPSGARTAGNTPAQSPSLFSPTFGKKQGIENEDVGYSTPMLHPTHLQAPKE